MKCVLYTNDLEPITVIELSEFAQQHLLEHRHVRLAVMMPLTPPSKIPPWATAEVSQAMRTVTIEAEPLKNRLTGTRALILFTADEESALLLKAAFLPGQQAALNERADDAFAQGFLAALETLGRG